MAESLQVEGANIEGFGGNLKPLEVDIVSIQSNVVYGYVGNNVALPTLTRMGHEVVAVPTVILSNVPQYASLHGGAIPQEWFEGYLQDLVARDCLRSLKAVTTGYLGGPDQLAYLSSWIEARLAENPDLHVVIDPVLGDREEGMYVDGRMCEAYQKGLLPLAVGLTPNDFELEMLTGIKINTIDDVIRAARSLIKGRTEWVAVTSAVPSSWDKGEMRLLLVDNHSVHLVKHPCIDMTPKGTGDLFSSSFVGFWLKGDALHSAMAKACQVNIDALRETRKRQTIELVLPHDLEHIEAREVSITRLD